MKKWTFLLPFLCFGFVSLAFDKSPSRRSTKVAVSKSLVFPVTGSKNHIRDRWGASRDGGSRRHKGIDIHARKGTPVVAVCDGVIVERDHTSTGGKTLWLQSAAYGWKAYYAHLDKHLVKEGQWVKKGTVIGTVGNTGNARHTPAHLHYGISTGKGWLNPLPYVKYSPKLAAKKPTTTKRKRR